MVHDPVRTPNRSMTQALPSLDQAYRHCREVTRLRARNFYYGLKLTPEPKRSSMYAVYAWMRRADDLADAAVGSLDQRRAAIDAFRSRTRMVLRAGSASLISAAAGSFSPSDELLFRALADTAQRHRLSPQPFFDMLAGQEADLSHREYQSFDELRGFCYDVASTVGLVCIEVWGFNNSAARELALDQGVAFQLTNIIRDFKQDLDQGRCYLPMAELNRAGLTPESLRNWSDPTACTAFIQAQADRAEQYYQRSRDLLSMISPDCRPTLWAMTEIYHRLLQRIRQDPASIVRLKRVRLSSFAKAAIAFRAQRMSRSPALAEAQIEFSRSPVMHGAAAQ